MPSARDSLTCGLVSNTDTGEREIVAAGGSGNSGYTDIVEIFDISTKSWRRAGRVSVSEES
jgi:hypothetical protein